MKTSTWANLYAVGAVSALLILTAWGNAIAMFVASAVGIVTGLLTLGRSSWRYPALSVLLVACAVAVAVAVMLLHR